MQSCLAPRAEESLAMSGQGCHSSVVDPKTSPAKNVADVPLLGAARLTVDGVVPLALDGDGREIRHQLRSCVLPENPFKPFERCGKELTITPAKGMKVDSQASQPRHCTSAGHASAKHITPGVCKAPDNKTLQIDPSVNCSGSCPSSVAKTSHPLSADPGVQRVSSTWTRGSTLTGYTTGVFTYHGGDHGPCLKSSSRSQSAASHVGGTLRSESHRIGDTDIARQPRSRSASDHKGSDKTEGSGIGGEDGADRHRSLAQSTPRDSGSSQGDDLYEGVYEDLDDEDNGELDKKISTMENQFSMVGRERSPPATFGAPRMRSARQGQAPPLTSTIMGSHGLVPNTARNASWIRTSEQEPAKLSNLELGTLPYVGNRPMSVPCDTVLSGRRGIVDASQVRRRKLEVSSAQPGNRESTGGVMQAQGHEDWSFPKQRHEQTCTFVRDVKTAVPSWDRHAEESTRPLSCATFVDSGEVAVDERRRPSSAAFERWLETRPGVRSFLSAVSSARTLGTDDPEFSHLQLEMERRRSPMSEAALSRMEDHYAVLSLKNAPGPAVRESAKGGRSNSLRNDRAGGLLRENMSRKPLSSKHKSSLSGGDRVKDERSIRSGSKRGRRPERRGAASKARRENSRVLSSASVTSKRGRGKGLRGKGTVTELSDRRSRSPPAERRKNQRAHPDDAASKVPRQTYLSARAFMDQHFPREDMQGVSPLGVEQLQECSNVSAAFSRAGLLVSSEALRRALVIPTDQLLEMCLAGLPHPLEGFRDKPCPIPSNTTTPSIPVMPQGFFSRRIVTNTRGRLADKMKARGRGKRRPKSPPKSHNLTAKPSRLGKANASSAGRAGGGSSRKPRKRRA